MNINTSINIYYEGLNPSDTLDPLTQIYMSVDRFIKDDNDTIMDCHTVLGSVLNIFNANIAQIDGQWYIYKSNEIVENTIVKFRQYSKTNNGYLGLNTKNLAFKLGSHINNFYPHHANGNQQIEIKGSISAARINYKYGFLQSLNTNPNLNYNNFIYPDWTIINSDEIVFSPLKNSGLLLYPDHSVPNPGAIIESNGFNLTAGEIIKFRANVNRTTTGSTLLNVTARFRVTLLDPITSISYFLKNDGTWQQTTPVNITAPVLYNLSLTVQSFALPASGVVKITIFMPIGSTLSTNYLYEVTKADIEKANATQAETGAIGEFHTVQRQNRPSSISTETTTVYNGDSASLVYEGAIWKLTNTIPTSVWFRRGKTESKPILRIAAEDILRMSQKPQKIFIGDVYGFLPYLSVVSIDNLEGKFMPIEWSFDSKSNITSVKLLEAFNAELTDIDYKYTLDYGNTVKPTITS
jgi:hypothetical protein